MPGIKLPRLAEPGSINKEEIKDLSRWQKKDGECEVKR